MNDTREAARQFRIQKWTRIIHDRAQSGMTVKDYCAQNNLSRDAYFYWARIIKEQAIKKLTVTDQRFIELPAGTAAAVPSVYPEPSPEVSELLLTIGQVQISVTERTSPALLARTLEVVRNAL